MQGINEAIVHAESEYPRESCGIIVNDAYVPCKNKHEDPLNFFEISPEDYLKASKSGDIQAIVHSHPDGKDFPTYTDMNSQIHSNVPWAILPKDKEVVWFGLDKPPKLLGREFKHGVTDCYSLIRDWYKLEKGVELVEFARDFEWWESGDDNLYLDNFKEVGFKLIDMVDIVPGDCLLASIMSSKVNHGAVFLGNNMIMHHLVGRLSVKEPLSRWSKYFTIALRYCG